EVQRLHHGGVGRDERTGHEASVSRRRAECQRAIDGEGADRLGGCACTTVCWSSTPTLTRWRTPSCSSTTWTHRTATASPPAPTAPAGRAPTAATAIHARARSS